MRLTLLLLALTLTGCQGCNSVVDYEPQAGQTAAMRVVWNEVYSMVAPPPIVGWVNQDSLNCNKDPSGDYDGFRLGDEYGNDCVWGVTWERSQQIWISHPVPEFTSFSFHNAFAHELWHYSLFLNTGNADPKHTDPGFGRDYGHPSGGAVDLADNALMAAGL